MISTFSSLLKLQGATLQPPFSTSVSSCLPGHWMGTLHFPNTKHEPTAIHHILSPLPRANCPTSVLNSTLPAFSRTFLGKWTYAFLLDSSLCCCPMELYTGFKRMQISFFFFCKFFLRKPKPFILLISPSYPSQPSSWISWSQPSCFLTSHSLHKPLQSGPCSWHSTDSSSSVTSEFAKFGPQHHPTPLLLAPFLEIHPSLRSVTWGHVTPFPLSLTLWQAFPLPIRIRGTYFTEKLSVEYLSFKFNWMSCIFIC